MAEEPDRIRDDIELTRAQLAHNVDRLADKTVPSRVAQRGWQNTKDKVRGVTDRVMGAAHDSGHSAKASTTGAVDTVKDKASDAADTVRETASDVAGRVQQTPAAVRRQTQGNPLAAGLIAFGAGLLAASLLPATEIEKRAGRQVRDHADELIEPMKQPLTEAAQELGEKAKAAATSVADTAKDAAQSTAQAAKSNAQDATSEVKQNVKASTGS